MINHEIKLWWGWSLGSSFIGEIVYNGGKALSTRTFFSRKKC